MKISKLTKLTGYSRNTIQYYTRIGLLMPLQKGADHDYTQREVDDLAYIEKLKAMSFSIKDIQAIIRLKRLSNWHEPATRKSFKTLLDSQKNKVQERIINLEGESFKDSRSSNKARNSYLCSWPFGLSTLSQFSASQ